MQQGNIQKRHYQFF